MRNVVNIQSIFYGCHCLFPIPEIIKWEFSSNFSEKNIQLANISSTFSSIIKNSSSIINSEIISKSSSSFEKSKDDDLNDYKLSNENFLFDNEKEENNIYYENFYN